MLAGVEEQTLDAQVQTTELEKQDQNQAESSSQAVQSMGDQLKTSLRERDALAQLLVGFLQVQIWV